MDCLMVSAVVVGMNDDDDNSTNCDVILFSTGHHFPFYKGDIQESEKYSVLLDSSHSLEAAYPRP
jgi:hypothetical protein